MKSLKTILKIVEFIAPGLPTEASVSGNLIVNIQYTSILFNARLPSDIEKM